MRTIGDTAIAQELMKEYSEGRSPPKAMLLTQRGTLTVTGDSELGFKNRKGSTSAENAMRDLLDPANTVFNTNGWVGAQAWRVTFGLPEGFRNTIYLKHCVAWLMSQHKTMLEAESNRWFNVDVRESCIRLRVALFGGR